MMVKMFNVSLEDFKIQCDSKVFVFKKRSATLVDDYLVQFVHEQTKDRGVFPIYLSMDKAAIKKAARTAMLLYLSGTIQQRIRNYASQHDDFRKKGVTFANSPHYERALRWEKEIIAMLEIEAPIHEELSFLDTERREALGIDDKRVQQFSGEDLFDADELVFENTETLADAGIAVKKTVAVKGKKGFQSYKAQDLEKDLEA